MQLVPADQAIYDAIVAGLRRETASYPPALRALAEPSLEQLIGGEFSQIAALLPAWLQEVAPLAAETAEALGAAGLALWWYAQIVDDLLDGAAPVALLPVAQTALLRALDGYRALGLLAGPRWPELLSRASGSAEAYATEIGGRVADPASVSDEHLAGWTPALLMERAAPFGFTASAQLDLAGLADDEPLRAALNTALGCLAGARQIADDASDWLDDLRAGQLNYVSAGLIRHFRANMAPAAHSDLSLERLAGYELSAERYWQEVETTHAELCRQAQEALAPHGAQRLRGLTAAQRDHDEAVFARMRARRAALRDLFGG